jgi:ElaB/YqjD/DUF883 family membrane-anchored ribosome-binding protein
MTNKNPHFGQNIKKAGEKISETSEAFSEKFTDAQYHVSKFVKKNPYKAIGYSVLAGLILANLLRLRK